MTFSAVTRTLYVTSDSVPTKYSPSMIVVSAIPSLPTYYRIGAISPRTANS